MFDQILNRLFSVRKQTITLLLVTFFLLTLPACVSHLVASQMVGAPNSSLVGYELSNQFSNFDKGHDGLLSISGVQQKKISLPSRKISLSYIDIAAGDYGFSYSTKAILRTNGSIGRISTNWQWLDPSCHASQEKGNTSGVLVLLHGWGRNKNSLLSYGLAFAQQGYRVIIPDLRGHGDSTGDWVSFGAEEGLDISALIDQLAIEKYDVIGFSLGASTGIHTASIDNRLTHLVVIAPMHSLSQTIPKFVKQSPKWIGNLVANNKDNALAIANDMSGYVYAQTSDTVSAAQLVTNPVLFVYGSIDKMSGQSLNQLLFEQGSQNNQLHRLEGLRHTHVLLHQSALMKPINQWLGLNKMLVPGSATNSCNYKQFNI